jgi:hypothetical protein
MSHQSIDSKDSRDSFEEYPSLMNQTSGSSIFEGKLQEIVRLPSHKVERMNLAVKKSLSREQSKDLNNYLKQNFLFAEIPEFETL